MLPPPLISHELAHYFARSPTPLSSLLARLSQLISCHLCRCYPAPPVDQIPAPLASPYSQISLPHTLLFATPLKIQLRRRAAEDAASSTSTTSSPYNAASAVVPTRVRALTDASARRRNSARWSFSGAPPGPGLAQGQTSPGLASALLSAGNSAAGGPDLGLQAEALLRKQEARIEALRAEAAAIQFQSESRTQELAAAQRSLARRDSDVQVLRSRVAELETQLERQRQTELQMAADLQAAQKRSSSGGLLNRVCGLGSQARKRIETPAFAMFSRTSPTSFENRNPAGAKASLKPSRRPWRRLEDSKKGCTRQTMIATS